MYNYFALALISTLGIIFLDDDPHSVSLQEWILYAVLIYSAISFFRKYRELLSREKR
ncbi:MAG: hypothetical protein PHE55_07285 [Methylococcaceae bacterium]|nr:hypothetical protein [Methylococcaceae bacterium]